MPLGSSSSVPVSYLASDLASTCVVLSVYNLSAAAASKITSKAVLIVLQPTVKRIAGPDPSFYDAVQVYDPRHLLVDGKPPALETMAPPNARTEHFTGTAGDGDKWGMD